MKRIKFMTKSNDMIRIKSVFVVLILAALLFSAGFVGAVCADGENGNPNDNGPEIPTQIPTTSPTTPTDVPTTSPTTPTDVPTTSPTTPTDVPTTSPTTPTDVPTTSPTTPTVTPTAPQPIQNVVLSLTTPRYGANMYNTVSVTTQGVKVKSVTWNPTEPSSKFQAEKEYTVTVTLETESNAYKFSSEKPSVKAGTSTIAADDVTRVSDNEISFKYKFPKIKKVILPTITASATPESGGVPLEVTITYNITNSTRNQIKYGEENEKWVDLIGNSGTVKHIYNNTGTYTVNISARNNNDTVYRTLTIKATDPTINANFDYSPKSGNAPLKVSFTDKSEASGKIEKWEWDFGGKGTSTEKNPTFTFKDAGTYKITLKVTDAFKKTDTCEKTITVNPKPATPTQTSSSKPTVSATHAQSGGEDTDLLTILNPLNIIREFIKMLLSLFNAESYNL